MQLARTICCLFLFFVFTSLPLDMQDRCCFKKLFVHVQQFVCVYCYVLCVKDKVFELTHQLCAEHVDYLGLDNNELLECLSQVPLHLFVTLHELIAITTAFSMASYICISKSIGISFRMVNPIVIPLLFQECLGVLKQLVRGCFDRFNLLKQY